ncbi:hypothetical protein VPHD485_0131 [Vibrio phage D485]
MINNEILKPVFETIDITDPNNVISIEVMNDEISSDDFDNFIEYCVEAEINERKTQFAGYFSGDFLVLGIAEERFSFFQTLDTETLLNEDAANNAFDAHIEAFVQWYTEKVSEFFVIENVELNVETV